MRLVGCGYVDRPLVHDVINAEALRRSTRGENLGALFARALCCRIGFFSGYPEPVASTRCLVAEAVLSSPAYFC